jgi:WD40 repeat protein
MNKILLLFALIFVSKILLSQEIDTVKLLKITNLKYDGSPVAKFSYSPDGKYLATFREDSTLTIENPQSGKILWEFKPKKPEDRAIGYAFAPLNLIGICVVDYPSSKDTINETDNIMGYGTIYLYDLETGKGSDTIPLDDSFCSNFAFSKNGQYMAGCFLGEVNIYDRNSKQWVANHKIEAFHGSIAFSHYGTFLIIADQYGIGVYETEKFISEKNSTQLRIDNKSNWKKGHIYNEKCIAFTQDDSRILTAFSNGMFLWKFGGNKPINNFGGNIKDIKPGCLAMTPDGKWAATAHRSDTLRIWNVEEGKVARIEQIPNIIGLAFRPDTLELVYIQEY